jgi:hypothetical protein
VRRSPLSGTSEHEATVADGQVFREVNRRILDLARSYDDNLVGYVCECGHVTCETPILEVPLIEVEPILARDEWLLVAPGHETPGTRIVRFGKGYVIVAPPDVAAS